MTTVIVSSVGTSLLSNLELQPSWRATLGAMANLRREELDAEQRDLLGSAELAARERLEHADAAEQQRASAELAVLVPLAAELRGERVLHWLVHSATEAGGCAARVLGDHLQREGAMVQLYGVEDLRTTCVDEFKLGMANLARWSTQTLPAHRARGDRVIFNVAGGFKTLSGYLQVLGMFHADETIYTFEGSRELLRVPRLPVRLVVDEEQAAALRRVRLSTRQLRADEVDLPESLLLTIDGEVGGLSAYGELVWDQAVDAGLYTERLLPSPHPRLRYADTLEPSIRGLAAGRLRELNRRIDQLYLYLDSDGGTNLRGLDVKQLQGTPVPGSTHEFDVWHDGATGRGFCHFEDEGGVRVLVVDRVGAALH